MKRNFRAKILGVKNTVPVEWACAFLGNKKYESLQAHYHRNPIFRFSFISIAILSQIVGVVIIGVIGIVIGSFLLSFLR